MHSKYKSYRATCHVTNLYPETDACMLTRPKICQNTTFTWLEHTRPSTKSHAIIAYYSTDSYEDNVTVHPYNGYIRSTNPIVRYVMSLTCALKHRLVSQCAPKLSAPAPVCIIIDQTLISKTPRQPNSNFVSYLF